MGVRSGGVRAIVPLAVAAVFGTLAVVTVEQAGCTDPGRYQPVAGGYELVGGCFDPEDLVVPTTPDLDPAPASPVPPRS
ncbi:hypothetical protein [Pseudonocardia pini]|uniref:hypothetical protein n=1 Tax=Pseudonocardia pini TaxID=2758030 RepID=UPI0015F007ED|nr:hypothetical protein [Pseudonocardia pini]